MLLPEMLSEIFAWLCYEELTKIYCLNKKLNDFVKNNKKLAEYFLQQCRRLTAHIYSKNSPYYKNTRKQPCYAWFYRTWTPIVYNYVNKYFPYTEIIQYYARLLPYNWLMHYRMTSAERFDTAWDANRYFRYHFYAIFTLKDSEIQDPNWCLLQNIIQNIVQKIVVNQNDNKNHNDDEIVEHKQKIIGMSYE